MSEDELILVVKKDKLFADKQFQGFLPVGEFDYYNLILDNYQWQARDKVEEDSSYQQPIGYCLIYNPEFNKIFAFQRHIDDEKYTDKRLQGKWSWGVGGHIDKIDAQTNPKEDPIITATLRELEEEVVIDGEIEPKIIGYINDDSDSVGQVHFGIVYLIYTDAVDIKPNDDEIMNYSYLSLEKLANLKNNPANTIENWSEVIFDPINDLLNNQQQD
jgi:predicted NUDIX family phosphoesterase